MIIWGAATVPLVTAFVLAFWFKHRTLWWEMLIPVVASLVFIAGFKYTTETVQTSDTEFWGGWATHAEYFEAWNERVTCTHTKYCPSTCRRSDGTTYSCDKPCGKQHAYDVRNHPPRWVLNDSNGASHSIKESRFNDLVILWGNKTFKDLGRNYHTRDGDKYITRWEKDDATLVPVTTSHTYENRVQAAHTVFDFEEVDPFAWGLYNYPPIKGLDQRAVLGRAKGAKEADKLLRFYNAKLGAAKQVKMFLFLFGPETTLDTGLAQENYLVGSNKNEFIVMVGLDANGQVNWVHVISWTENEYLKIDVRDYVREMEVFDPVEIVEYMAERVGEDFVRKEFADFSYLTVEPPLWAVLLCYLLTLAINLGLSFWVVQNQHKERYTY